MSEVNNFVLILPCGVEPPSLPWASEITLDNHRAARWVRLDLQVCGDNKVMEVDVYGLVTNNRGVDAVDEVIDAFHALELDPARGAVLVVRRQHGDHPEVYRVNGAPELLAAVRSPKPRRLS